MFGGPASRAPGHSIVVLLALIGLGWLALQWFNPADKSRISSWAPPAQGYGSQAEAGLKGFAAPPLSGRGMSNDQQPQGNPLGVENTVMTQGYGVGSHAPAATWGAVDLAIDGDHNGIADPEGSWDHPVYATHSGLVTVTPDSWPAGNHIWIVNESFRTGYAHLARFAVTNGQLVERGQLIGYIGSTGQSSGPHLDYQVWERQGDRWINRNPLNFGVLAGIK